MRAGHTGRQHCGRPAGLRLDLPGNLGQRLDRFIRDFGLAIALVLVTLLPLGLRAAFVVMVSIPLSLAIGLLLLKLCGFTINQISIVGFVISLGSYVRDLTDLAVETAGRIGRVTVDMGNTACKVPSAAEYIEKVRKRGSIGKKRKTARC